VLRLQGLTHGPQLSSIRVLLKLWFFRDWVGEFRYPRKIDLVVGCHNRRSKAAFVSRKSDYLTEPTSKLNAILASEAWNEK
jgi:hypothetical protein